MSDAQSSNLAMGTGTPLIQPPCSLLNGSANSSMTPLKPSTNNLSVSHSSHSTSCLRISVEPYDASRASYSCPERVERHVDILRGAGESIYREGEEEVRAGEGEVRPFAVPEGEVEKEDAEAREASRGDGVEGCEMRRGGVGRYEEGVVADGEVAGELRDDSGAVMKDESSDPWRLVDGRVRDAPVNADGGCSGDDFCRSRCSSASAISCKLCPAELDLLLPIVNTLDSRRIDLLVLNPPDVLGRGRASPSSPDARRLSLEVDGEGLPSRETGEEAGGV